MIFWTITSREFGRFCGYKRKWHDLWLLRPMFRWDTFPQHGEVMIFLYEEAARKFLLMHPDLPADCEVKLSDLDNLVVEDRLIG
ncbi:MAG TPA: hypothetical protein VNS88_09075 [Nitrospiraceae bacterium]|nr:hypothetical protein [Nitrospiraceae bacterium]